MIELSDYNMETLEIIVLILVIFGVLGLARRR